MQRTPDATPNISTASDRISIVATSPRQNFPIVVAAVTDAAIFVVVIIAEVSDVVVAVASDAFVFGYGRALARGIRVRGALALGKTCREIVGVFRDEKEG